MKLTKNKIYIIFLIVFFAFVLFFRINNALNYNCYWGYDGAKHIEYIDTIEGQHRLPTFEENYLAWHEPLYYGVFAVFGSIYKFISSNNDFMPMIKFLQIVTAILDVFFLFVFYKILNLLTKNKLIKLATLFSVAFFTPLIIVNNYLTNELFLYWLTILTLYFIIKSEKTFWNYKRIIGVGFLMALMMLTKLSALVFIACFFIYFLYKYFYFKKAKILKYLLLLFLIIFVLNLPWQIYRAKNFGGVFTVNNYELLQNEKLPQIKDIPNNFFINFNFEIFKNPFWQSGRNSFWSIVFAQLFVDYDNIGGNVDLNNNQMELITGNGRFISLNKFILSRMILSISITLFVILIIGYISEIIEFIKRKFKPDIKFLFLLFITSSFVALIYNVFKNPFIERGTLKVIFILSIWPLLFFLGYKNLDEMLTKNKLKYLWVFICLIIIAYSYLSLKINWVPKY